jgi:Arc/MetJ family transcription regulator
MRTTVEIDDQLMRDALRLTGLKSKRAVIELGLRTLVRLDSQARIRQLRGKVACLGDLEFTRIDSNLRK